MQPIFNTSRRIRLGIWGLGRGASFFKACEALNFEIVAGCDFNQHLRDRFTKANPRAMVTADAAEFLAQDFDAVLLATFCPDHAEDAIRCLNAGKHVLSEVTAFHTPAEGVKLVEAVERTGLVYNLAENYPFSAANMWLEEKWREGLFGELMYAEFEYVHELRELAYLYLDGSPIQPDGSLHSWRSWMDYHFYCTHSLGPIMLITGTRPTRVVSLPATQVLPGYPATRVQKLAGLAGIAPSLINMSNGGVVRNLMGSTTADTHVQRLWGTRGAAFQNAGKPLELQLGGFGHSPKHGIKPSWPKLGEQAANAGHGGGDFWVLYYFARQILTGERAPIDVYAAADMTLPGILAYRSALENGRPYEVPDFRDKKQRDAWRNDDARPARLDTKRHLFGDAAGTEKVKGFNALFQTITKHIRTFRAYKDWSAVANAITEPDALLNVALELQKLLPELVKTYTTARKIADANPGTEGARVLEELLEFGGEREAISREFADKLRAHINSLRTGAKQPELVGAR
ncbi:MAG TPA: Gfo/Idh/MocA family oxidoreductase [Planctomycetota bacterium]|nr:Gfo/Idh/MocA family oxidoreductase [Planctomycetota bacterium]